MKFLKKKKNAKKMKEIQEMKKQKEIILKNFKLKKKNNIWQIILSFLKQASNDIFTDSNQNFYIIDDIDLQKQNLINYYRWIKFYFILLLP